MINLYFKHTLKLFLLITLTGCATHQQFDCPYKEGARCLSVEEIDRKINAGEIAETKNPHAKKAFSFFKAKSASISLEDTTAPPSPLRTEERVLSLWVAPYYTVDGAYHEGRRIHFVAKEASWRGVAELGETP